MIYFIADTHFNDVDILSYENRPFKDTKEMNETIIENWNSVVNEKDTVFHLGDVGEKEDTLYEIISRLRGTKILIKGNHDNRLWGVGFQEIIDYPIILDNFWILSHEPMYINKNMPYANIFGHVHNNPIYKDFSSQHYCVSVERINYTPISFDKIKRTISFKQN